MLIAFPAPRRMPPCSPFVSTAPAPRNSNCKKFRPFKGNWLTCCWVTTWPTEALSVSMETADSCTFTVSVTSPT